MKNIHLIRRFLPYYKPYWRTMVLDLFCAALTTLCEIVLPLFVRDLTGKATENLSLLTMRYVLTLGGIYILLRIIDTVAAYYMATVGHVCGTRIETDMRRALFDHLQKLPFRYFDEAKIGQIMSRLTNDLFEVTEFAHHCPEEFFIAGIKIIASFIILSTYDIWLSVIVFLMIPVMILCLYKLNRKMRDAFRERRKIVGDLNSGIEDSLLGVRVVKSFANEDVEREKFERGNLAFFNIKKKSYRYMGAFQATTRLFDGLMYIIVVVVGALFLIAHRITAPDYIAYLLYISTLLASIRRIVEFTEQFQQGMTGIERFCEIMDQPVDIEDAPDARPLADVKGRVTFRNVTFGYQTRSGQVLDHLDLDVAPGESVALVGPSGGGKTTLCNLIPRFYDVLDGAVLVDGQDVRELTLGSLRASIGMVQQDVYLFSGTVYDNIVYGKPGATREEVVRAAKLAGADEFIDALPDGYDTYVGERGVKLSGGQKQRISIARVFLKDPPILILDEATSALDNESERLVQQSLEALAKGRTTFTIAHRLTTVRGADRILVLADHGIAEQGTHRELMEKNGLYASLYQMYTQL